MKAFKPIVKSVLCTNCTTFLEWWVDICSTFYSSVKCAFIIECKHLEVIITCKINKNIIYSLHKIYRQQLKMYWVQTSWVYNNTKHLLQNCTAKWVVSQKCNKDDLCWRISSPVGAEQNTHHYLSICNNTFPPSSV